MTTQTIEVRPKASKNATLVAIGCAIFTIAGLGMVFSGEEVFAGLLGIVLFGGGGLYGIPKMLRRRVSMVLTPEGIEQRYAEGSAYIPWSDVEKVGIISMFSNKMVGIRLKSYDRYLDRMSPSLAEFMTKSLPYLKLLTLATSLLDVPTSVTVWSKLEGHDVSEALDGFGKVGDLAQALLWSRKQYGYDLALSWAEIDRPATEFVALLEGYRSSAKQG
ncbi:MAG: DUF2982 domain-containing protein [Proteobacteria bacterium]|nr:DUF2982 domain-containing protein [Pseudomonadota bacterium]